MLVLVIAQMVTAYFMLPNVIAFKEDFRGPIIDLAEDNYPILKTFENRVSMEKLWWILLHGAVILLIQARFQSGGSRAWNIKLAAPTEQAIKYYSTMRSSQSRPKYDGHKVKVISDVQTPSYHIMLDN